MSQQTDIKILLKKFVLNQCTPQEIEQVVAYYQESQKTEDHPTVNEVKELITDMPEVSLPESDAVFSKIWAQVETQVDTDNDTVPVRKLNWKRYTTIAASFIFMLSTAWFLIPNNIHNQKNKPKLTGNEITLTLENGDVQIINEKGEITITDADGNIVANQDENTLSYGNDSGIEKLVYNTLNIPYGKKLKLQLSDGTVVNLNSGTTLKYPVKFIAGEQRTVYLEGEAFFDVAKDKAHPFVVNAEKLNVRVLGTHFNVSSYPEDNNTDVVLVEGSVGMYKDGETFMKDTHTVLTPGYKGSFSKTTGTIKTREVNTATYTAWIKGELVFRNMGFKSICKKLERHYNIVIENHNAELENERFNASFKDEPIENVLGYFNELHGIKYTINNNKIIIN